MPTRLMTACAACLVLSLPWVACARDHDLVAKVVVDGQKNCISADVTTRAQRVHLAPGLYTFWIEPGRGIIYGDRAIYRERRAVNVLLKFDPLVVSRVLEYDPDGNRVEVAKPVSAVALSQPDGHMPMSMVHVLAKAPTDAHLFVVDRNAADNRGWVTVRLDKGYTFGIPDGRALDYVRVGGRENCVVFEPASVARSVALEPGEYYLQGAEGSIAYVSGERGEDRATADVLVDLDPACAQWQDVGCGHEEGEEFGEPIAALSLGRPERAHNLRILRRTRLYFYVLDRTPGDNSGAVSLEIRRGQQGI